MLANIETVRWVYKWAASSSDPFSPEVICEIHAKLATADRHLSAQAGQIRSRQNWIGNGRVGRSLIGAVLARRQICRDVIPLVSLVLSRDRDAYITALTTWRFEIDGYRQWIVELGTACEAAALASPRLGGQVSDLQDCWREASDHPRRDSAAAIIDALPAYPILDAGSVAALTGRSAVAARQALNNLTDSGVLEQVTVGKRNRIWESVGLFALIDDMERELSAGLRSPVGTR